MNGTGTDRGLLPAVNLRLFCWSLAFALIIPAITTLIEYLIISNPSFRTSLQVNLKDFHLYQLFTSWFVHVNFSHYLGNVTAYLLIVIYGLLLATILNRLRLYVVLTKVVVIVFIVLGALFTLFTMDTTYYGGLSGINASLAGVLLLFWLLYLEQQSGRSRDAMIGIVLVLILALFTGIIARYQILYHPARSSLLVEWLVMFSGLFLVAAVIFRHQFSALYRDLKIFTWSTRIMTAAIAVVFLYFIWNIFPGQLPDPTRVVSISLHLAAILIGVFCGFICLLYLAPMDYFRNEAEVPSGPGR